MLSLLYVYFCEYIKWSSPSVEARGDGPKKGKNIVKEGESEWNKHNTINNVIN